MEKISYQFGLPQRGDVVIVDRPGEGTNLIKRVIGLPGDVIEIKSGQVWIDGESINEPWVENFGGPSVSARKVPPDFIFILGDNRSLSMDSRTIGPVPINTVIGRVILIYWPPGSVKLFP
jgi:signal peptidase I